MNGGSLLLVSVASVVMSLLGTADILASEFPEHGLRVETVAENLTVPWSVAFAPDGRMFLTERHGNVRVIEDGVLRTEPMLTLSVGRNEGGLLGIAIDPDFENNRHVYLYYTYVEFMSVYNRVSKFTESDNKLYDEMILVDKVPGAAIHDGGRIRFGPDNTLYITTGDAANRMLSQDPLSLAGKILRINTDGTIPDDNPFAGSPVYSYGHRNPQGLDWDPSTGILVISEHGPSGERGFAHDEINVIHPGKNYGWPHVVGSESDPLYVDPAFHTGNTAWAPSGISFYNGDKIPSLKGKLLVANLRGSHLHVFDVDTEQNKATSEKSLFVGTFGRLRDVSIGHDGHIYILTSNLDGRGSPTINDDRVLKIVPIETVTSPPLKQLQHGYDASHVDCGPLFELVFKASNGNPACVRPDTKIKLMERGWAHAS